MQNASRYYKYVLDISIKNKIYTYAIILITNDKDMYAYR